MKTLTLNDIEFEIIAEMDQTPVCGNAVDSGDNDQDTEIENEILRRLDMFDVWAWCQIEVKGTYKGILVASDYLGCCSYENEKDFKENSGYYEDMQNAVLDEIQAQLNELTTL